ncbi:MULTISPECIES: methionyl-tRNA formyltransferase [Acidithiobacillus]|uniref:Methionyl-tRNA formyltransferase n=2 Tax=Acidithiobacillus TaxID=119977 RepID=A0A179B7C3_ACIFR|nr:MULTISPECIES: methionyl-tRNA formyltransferase [Acidithiobacillus]MDA8181649.1 methionyl-tRNA formyltransferase [Acidithiobacillus sp.]MEB8487854.1 methionyl-tRNA formyltransferase [Acidithiobacillus ferriphilus]MEB8489704.1 methionyl-tRNA formyltransferase [Acidithiobacillus ferriphilus]MEB8492545.1 methionyl-tRNA formyltransferase [Acidithiobacillus ferriphilus]MEB8513752.1 methionyl-tRNA formyltransferase [Acidithiobacillus ferriphilus]
MTRKQRIVFAGTPEFARLILAELLQGPEEVVGVFTQPDRPAGRGRALQASPVKQEAVAAGIPVFQPESCKTGEALDLLRSLAPDLLIVVAYGQILPQVVLDLPTRGAINVHASLLPAWRGAAPIARAIAAGDKESGVAIMQMEAGLDSGPVLWAERVPIAPDDTAASLHDRLARLGSVALRRALDGLWANRLKPVPQDPALATYARKLKKEEARIDWRFPAATLERLVRAFNPSPVAHTLFRDKGLRVWQTQVLAVRDDQAPGTISAVGKDGIVVACGEDQLQLLAVQPAGKGALSGSDFVRGYRPQIGEVLG